MFERRGSHSQDVLHQVYPWGLADGRYIELRKEVRWTRADGLPLGEYVYTAVAATDFTRSVSEGPRRLSRAELAAWIEELRGLLAGLEHAEHAAADLERAYRTGLPAPDPDTPALVWQTHP